LSLGGVELIIREGLIKGYPMSFSISLTFSSQSLSMPQLQSFSKRVETKPLSQAFEISILPDFWHESMEQQDFFDCWEDLADLAENHFLGIDETGLLKFKGLSCLSGALGLAPQFENEWFYCQEEIKDTLLERGFQFKKTKNRRKRPNADLEVFMPIAQFNEDAELEMALALASNELQLPLVLLTSTLNLYEKTAQGTRLIRHLFTFLPTAATLEIERYSFAG
jgi:hypothetical protein